jgi:hypothetical protein
MARMVAPLPAPPLDVGGLLGLWDRAAGLGPVDRALALAAAAGEDPAVLRRRPVGQVNGIVLGLRETLLGPDLAATAACPACAARVEFALDVRDLRAVGPAPGPANVAAGGYTASWRPPEPDDLLAVAASSDPAGDLRRRCLSANGPDGDPVDPATLPAGLLDEIEAAMAGADPLAEVLVTVACPGCGTAFDADVDPGAFVWTELDARARRLLHEVDVLARAYGWTEPEVLALSEARRAAYLRLVMDGVP